jgi:hypothetical protein
MKNDDGFLVPMRAFLIFLFVVFCCSILAYVWLSNQPVECDIADQVELKGILRGFTQNKSYWFVKIDNESYLFDRFDRDYMRSLLGYNITLSCCYRPTTAFEVAHYDMCCAYINEAE